MEGTKCCFSACGVYDFLPFTCDGCNKQFCLEHRGKFSHECDSLNARSVIKPVIGTQQESVRSVFAAIENRFCNSAVAADEGSNVVHPHAVKSNNVPIKMQRGEKLQSKLVRLQHSSTGKYSSAKQKKLSNSARDILLKSTAKGHPDIYISDRIYLNIAFEESNASMCHYFSKNMTLGDSLEYLARTFPQFCFGKSVRPPGLSLTLSSKIEYTQNGKSSDNEAIDCVDATQIQTVNSSLGLVDHKRSLLSIFSGNVTSEHTVVVDVSVLSCNTDDLREFQSSSFPLHAVIKAEEDKSEVAVAAVKESSSSTIEISPIGTHDIQMVSCVSRVSPSASSSSPPPRDDSSTLTKDELAVAPTAASRMGKVQVSCHGQLSCLEFPLPEDASIHFLKNVTCGQLLSRIRAEVITPYVSKTALGNVDALVSAKMKSLKIIFSGKVLTKVMSIQNCTVFDMLYLVKKSVDKKTVSKASVSVTRKAVATDAAVTLMLIGV